MNKWYTIESKLKKVNRFLAHRRVENIAESKQNWRISHEKDVVVGQLFHIYFISSQLRQVIIIKVVKMILFFSHKMVSSNDRLFTEKYPQTKIKNRKFSTKN